MISSILGASTTMRSHAKLGKEGSSKLQEILSVITCEDSCEFSKMNNGMGTGRGQRLNECFCTNLFEMKELVALESIKML